ncbi:RNA polymerase subunit sigma [Vibrio coralliilyticus]|uniref:RNA polymerase subunit sigma n=1 Tax=Vibrio coralliilyticus TaxID=190893 RepID=A0A837G2Q5_9VIBR|nr:DUF2500 domain-containing protein [Vibrio coralliilyticus]AIU68384.1 RNA polymerase subunit sigma [Vibrio coralliilyticus]ANW24504.1 RNA polymerase subunit sigma [Vibrio coralliilyticus]KJY67558.1 RNA polymerase subunit sigma [Vibrio coralliilyticus]NUW66173.1 DUF2500 domain-containing protein [Vibrio coralliilyticus]QOU29503.1 DUF2500 domain-containing protein [Vibrio coralliilyticus]
MPLTLFIAIIVFVLASGWVFSRLYRRHIQGEDAPEQTADVTVLDKQAIDVHDAQPGQDEQEYWIYVQKGRLGPKREFQVGVHYFHALNPGDKGMLTYQGDKFLHFAMKR